MPILFIIIGAILSKTTGIKAIGTLLSLVAALTLMISYYGWIWTAGIAIYKQDNSDKKLNLNIFRLSFILSIFLFIIITPILKMVLKEDSVDAMRVVGLIPLLLFFFCIYFITASIRSIEKQRNIKTSSMLLNFLLIWILPIGIWILQPKINVILLKTDENAR
ncbi:MAG: hypothetical protein CVT99_09235 [Bacteroidetes bacterium HGW-Bacteroidetes-16]|jgi:O-antigen/teichoic acid export membrane protein|nr:MAG: hypothetical protein CVT99_09235 [Bacteroidetes bacterium HGW-Bacteroidetes-16]